MFLLYQNVNCKNFETFNFFDKSCKHFTLYVGTLESYLPKEKIALFSTK